MSEAAFEVLESEAYGPEGEGEGEGYGEAYPGEAGYGEAGWEGLSEDARSDARRRARQREIMLARQRQMQQRRRPPQPARVVPAVPPAAAPTSRPSPATITALREVDLDNKVTQDALRRATEQANRRAARATYSALATGAISQALDTYEDNLKDHPFVRDAGRYLPIAILPAVQQRKGIEGVLLHPAFIGGALIGGIFLVGRFTAASQDVTDVRIAAPGAIQAGETGTLTADPVDRGGRTVTGAAITWTSDNDTVLKITDSARGTFTTGPGTGSVRVTATADKLSRSAYVNVTASAPTGVRDITIDGPRSVTVNDEVIFVANPIDESGRLASGVEVKWRSDDKFLQLESTTNDPATAKFKALATAGSTAVTATAGDVARSFAVRVKPA